MYGSSWLNFGTLVDVISFIYNFIILLNLKIFTCYNLYSFCTLDRLLHWTLKCHYKSTIWQRLHPCNHIDIDKGNWLDINGGMVIEGVNEVEEKQKKEERCKGGWKKENK